MGCLVQVFEHSGNALEDSWVEIREIAIIREVMFIIPSDLFREPRINLFKSPENNTVFEARRELFICCQPFIRPSSIVFGPSLPEIVQEGRSKFFVEGIVVVPGAEGYRGDAEEVCALWGYVVVFLKVGPDPRQTGGSLGDIINLGVVAAGGNVCEHEAEVSVALGQGHTIQVCENCGLDSIICPRIVYEGISLSAFFLSCCKVFSGFVGVV